MAGISDKALKTPYGQNKYRFNGGNELQNKEFSDGSGLEMYDATFRMYDAQIGRFWQLDPLALINEDWSPYSFASDNPILLNDPFGLADDSAALVPAPKPKPLPKPVCIVCGLPKPDVAKAAGPAPTQGNVHAGGDDHGTLWHLWNDHNVVTDAAYALNDYNPLAKAYDWFSTAITGHDSYDVKQNMVQASTKVLASVPIGGVGKVVQVGEVLIEEGASSIFSYITPKIAAQMARRGWSEELIHSVVNSPFAVRTAVNRATGHAATAFFTKEGFYVVKDNITNEVIQISNRLDPGWIPDAAIVNPFKP